MNIALTVEDRSTVDKLKDFFGKLSIDNIREEYKEKVVDTGKSQRMEELIEEKADKAKKQIKIMGTLATVALVFIPADGPFGELCTALATPGLCALVDLTADIEKKLLITGKRGIEKSLLKVDAGGTIEGYDLTKDDLVRDLIEAKSLADGMELMGRSR